MNPLKHESILQFGAGNFLRAFVDFFACGFPGRPDTGEVVVVQSTTSNRAAAINRAGGRYHVAVQGIANGRTIDTVHVVDSLSRALVANDNWQDVLGVAASPDLQWIVSNVTEAGLALDPGDDGNLPVPVSYPAKLLTVLLARHQAGMPGPIILPCELIEGNGAILRDAVTAQATRWRVDAGALAWIREDCVWAETLVDRIVPGFPATHPLAATDPLMLTTEPYALWAVAASRPLGIAHPALVETPDIVPWFLRKVRVLNGLHTALVAHAMPLGCTTVADCMRDPAIATWVRELLFDEIVPVLDGRVEDPAGFARDVLDRFANPFHNHLLSAIALHHSTKLETRLRPSLEDFRRMFGRNPRILSSLLP